MLVCNELLDAVGFNTTEGVLKLEEHAWLVVRDDVFDEVGEMVVVGVELRIDPIDEVVTMMVVFMERSTGRVVVPAESTMRYDDVDVVVPSEVVDDGCVTTFVTVCFEIEGMIGEAVTVFMSLKV